MDLKQWNEAVETYLSEYSALQDELLSVVTDDRARLSKPEQVAEGELKWRERQLWERLEACRQRRELLLAKAAELGLGGESLQAAAARLPRSQRSNTLQRRAAELAGQGRRLRYEGVVNWMLAQQSLVHVAHLLEILATGQHQPPTYGNGEGDALRGGLLDQAA